MCHAKSPKKENASRNNLGTHWTQAKLLEHACKAPREARVEQLPIAAEELGLRRHAVKRLMNGIQPGSPSITNLAPLW